MQHKRVFGLVLLTMAIVSFVVVVYLPVVPFQIETNVSPWCALRGGPCPFVFPGYEVNYNGSRSISAAYLRTGEVCIDGNGCEFLG